MTYHITTVAPLVRAALAVRLANDIVGRDPFAPHEEWLVACHARGEGYTAVLDPMPMDDFLVMLDLGNLLDALGKRDW